MVAGDKLHSFVNPNSLETRMKKLERKVTRIESHSLRKNNGLGLGGGIGESIEHGSGGIAVGISKRLPAPEPDSIVISAVNNYTLEGVWQPKLEVSINIALLGQVEGFCGFRYEVTDPLGNVSTYSGNYNPDTGAVTPLSISVRPNVFGESSNGWKVRAKVLSYTRGESVWSDYKTYALTPDSTVPATPTGLVCTSLPGGLKIAWDVPVDKNYSHSEVWAGTASLGTATLVLEDHARTPHQVIWDYQNHIIGLVYDKIYVRHINNKNVAGAYANVAITARQVDTAQIATNAITGPKLATTLNYSGTLTLEGSGVIDVTASAKIQAGGGKIQLLAGGVRVQADPTAGANNFYFYGEDGNEIGRIYASGSGVSSSIRYEATVGKTNLFGEKEARIRSTDAIHISQGSDLALNALTDNWEWTSVTHGNMLRLLGNRSLIVGGTALATNATNGFLYIPTSAGKPTGTPATYDATKPLEWDSTNKVLWLYDSSWRAVAGEGTSWPASPYTGMRFYRTDLYRVGYYDGTRWLGEPERLHYRILGSTLAQDFLTLSASSHIWYAHLPYTGSWWLDKIAWWVKVNTTNNGTDNWTLRLAKYSAGYGGTILLDLSTSGLTADQRRPVTGSIATTFDATAGNDWTLFIEGIKNSSPGNLEVYGATVTVREVL